MYEMPITQWLRIRLDGRRQKIITRPSDKNNTRHQGLMIQNESNGTWTHPAGPGGASDSEASGRPPATQNKRALAE